MNSIDKYNILTNLLNLQIGDHNNMKFNTNKFKCVECGRNEDFKSLYQYVKITNPYEEKENAKGAVLESSCSCDGSFGNYK